MIETALLDVRILPWRPRKRMMKASTLRDNADPFSASSDLEGVVVGLVLWLLIIIAAPVIVLVLAVGLLSIELPLVLVLGLALAVVRFTGVLPWTVVTINHVTGEERRDSYRNLWRAVRSIRAVNSDRRVKVRWAWA